LTTVGPRGWHARDALWNCGELVVSCASAIATLLPLEKFGSGKLGTPCVRMHCAKLSNRAWDCGLGAPPPAPPDDASDWHACEADWNAGELIVLLLRE
jgi:hypothetical protein